MTADRRAHLLVSGRVQGVWYRQSTREAAKRIGGLSGWVRNLPDGRVEAVAEGAEEKIEALIAWCREGPRLASVNDIEVRWAEPTGEFSGFDVTY